MNVKQVIVIRKDLKMRRGKEISQGAHASMAWLTKRLTLDKIDWVENWFVDGGFTEEEQQWVKGSFAKVCLQVNSEAELLQIYETAKEAGLEAHYITDSGATEFHGVPTVTCLAIGPDLADKIDLITQHLKLY